LFFDICHHSKKFHTHMNIDVFLEILKYTFPALLMLLLTYLILTNFVENEENRRKYLLRKESQKSALPIRLQAFERLSMFLERITPSNLLVRVSSKGLNVRDYQALLLKTIREEFEYNISQQIYVSEEAWRMVVTAKSATVSIINNLAATLPPELPAVELSKKILEKTMEMNVFPTRSAIHYLKQEVHHEF